jgi:hypothetical protein
MNLTLNNKNPNAEPSHLIEVVALKEYLILENSKFENL